MRAGISGCGLIVVLAAALSAAPAQQSPVPRPFPQPNTSQPRQPPAKQDSRGTFDSSGAPGGPGTRATGGETRRARCGAEL